MKEQTRDIVKDVPNCIICGLPVEPWPGGGGFGHNPSPIHDDGRACNWCNENVIIPVRLRIVTVAT